MSSTPFNVSILAFEGARSLLLSIPFAVFRTAQELAPGAGISVRAFALQPGRIRLDAADPLELDVAHGLEVLHTSDLVIVPSWYGAAYTAPPALTEALRQAYARGASVAGLCLGVFLLAQSGLLDNRPVAVMHEFSNEFLRQFPRSRIVMDATYVRDDRITTSAGRAAATDCCLALLAATFGDALGNRAAAHLNHAWRQPGTPSNTAPHDSLGPDDRRIVQLIDRLKLHPEEHTTVDALAHRVHMTNRTFTRHFRTLTGTAPNTWLMGVRLEHAKTLLRQSTLTIDAIASAAGYRTAAALRKQFREAVGTNPTDFRTAEAARRHTNAGAAAEVDLPRPRSNRARKRITDDAAPTTLGSSDLSAHTP